MAISKIKLPNNSVQDIHDSRITGVDSSPTSSSSNVVTSGGVYSAIAAAVFLGEVVETIEEETED